MQTLNRQISLLNSILLQIVDVLDYHRVQVLVFILLLLLKLLLLSYDLPENCSKHVFGFLVTSLLNLVDGDVLDPNLKLGHLHVVFDDSIVWY